MSGRDFPWHRVFHPLCGADPLTLARLVLRRGPPSRAGLAAFAVAVAASLARAPFTGLELLLDRVARDAPPAPPVFIVGHPRSGTTHLHNLMAASGAFATVPPVLAALPWESRTLGPLLRPFIDPFLPRTRLIDGVALRPDAPTEDEVGLANLGRHSYFHALYFPSAFARDYRAGLAGEASPADAASRDVAIRRYVGRMARLGPRRLLLKNPAYTARVDSLVRLFPGARIVHIHRDPQAVFASTRRALRAVLAELALQDWRDADLDAAVLETYPAVMRGLRDASAGLPPRTFAEVAFDDLSADPLPTLRRLWDRLDLPDWPSAAANIGDYLETVRDYRSAETSLTEAETRVLRRRWPRELALYGAPARLTAAESE